MYTNKPCGKGTYLTNHVEVAEHYSINRSINTTGCTINNNLYICIFQCRVDPNSIRRPYKYGTFN